MFKGLGNFATMLKQAQEMGARMQAMSDELRTKRATGAAGGGLVEIEVNGLSEVLQVRIDSKLFADGDRELAEDMVLAAVNQAMAKAKELHVAAMQSLTGGMDMPGLSDALTKLTGGEGPG